MPETLSAPPLLDDWNCYRRRGPGEELGLAGDKQRIKERGAKEQTGWWRPVSRPLPDRVCRRGPRHQERGRWGAEHDRRTLFCHPPCTMAGPLNGITTEVTIALRVALLRGGERSGPT
ncbi:hypothetical protein NDU88_004269 [Pleurodeles waltl]|uniref:Uncharacterized protein n=1 Tax=Pleurodeles waltl TaxID=8319 RepID=A0AAV7LL62_PLEWA|nr:hypothetical protein NDU88_004269 [Pleurodeles waltl]